MQAIEIKALSKSYGERRVLSELSLTLPLDRPVCLMGESGCGKTTLLRILAGLETADGGEIAHLPPAAMLFQEDRLLCEFSVRSNLRVLPHFSQYEKEIPRYLALLGLENELHTRVCELSGGMKRRIALLRACLTDAPLLLLDEPFTGLDADSHERAAAFIKDVCRDRAVILVTHDERDARMLGAYTVTLPAIS